MADVSNLGEFNKLPGGLEINVSAPGKVILHGEHAVVYGKKAVAAALGLRTKIKIVEIEQPDVIVLDIRPFGVVQSLKINDIQSIRTKNSSAMDKNYDLLAQNIEEYLKKTLKKDILHDKSVLMATQSFIFLLLNLQMALQVEITSLYVGIESELQIGAGTGSSASFSVCVAASLLQYFKCKLASNSDILENRSPLLDIWKSLNLKNFNIFSKYELSLICEWSFAGEKIFHGTPSGIDNTVCTYGNMVEFRKGQPPIHIQLKNIKFDLLLINSKVPRNTVQLVAKVADFRNQFPILVDKILDCIETVTLDAVGVIRKLEECDSEENFQKDFQNLTWLSQMNHIFLMSLGVSHPKLQEIMKILEENGLNGKLTGAGGGGFALALLPPGFETDKVTKELENAGFGVFCTKLGGEGVSIDS